MRSNKRHRINALGSLLLLGLLLAGILPRAFGQGSPKLQVVIVAVHSFNDAAYQNPVLQQGIEAAEGQLTAFFTQHFPNAAQKIVDLPQGTTGDALTSFFKDDFPALADGNVTLLFVLSHGEEDVFPDHSGGDLYVVTEDTAQANFKSKALSLSTDIVSRLNGRKPGTIVYAFIDTCHGAAAASAQLSLTSALYKAMGTNLMFMAASLSDQLSFKAGFTSALVKTWESQSADSCTSPEQSVQPLRKMIKDAASGQGVQLGPNEGFPAVLIPYHGSFCLESFNTARGFVVVQNATPSSVVVSFVDAQGNEVHEEPLEGNEVVAFGLPKKSYKLSFFQNNADVEDANLDLTGSSNVAYESFGTPEVAALASGLEKSSQLAAQMGAGKDVVTTLQQHALASYTVAGDNVAAQRIAALLPSSNTFLLNPAGSFDGLVEQASALKLQGNLRGAADDFLLAAKTVGGKLDSAKDAALEAYYAAAATEDPKKASGIRKRFGLGNQLGSDLVQLETRATKNGAVESKQSFSNAAAIDSLTTF
jgi:hypothetical protein